jgi:N-acetyl-alpha-D-muramate 1-phosphate uridylyltransferase
MKKLNTALILCAGFGKRVNPLTLKTPKPLLKVNDLTLLEKTINLIKNLHIKQITLNTFYLKDQIKNFIKKKNFNIDIEVIDDGNEILGTGGGVYNMIKSIISKSDLRHETDFLVFNPDTVWDLSYVKTINKMIDFHFSNLNQNTLLVVNKKFSFDKNLLGDFSFHNKESLVGDLSKNRLIKLSENDYIFTGCQLINLRSFSDKYNHLTKKNFSISEIWNNLIPNHLFGFESKNDFNHITNLDIYKKLSKN